MKELYDTTQAVNDKQAVLKNKKIFKYVQAYQVLLKPLVTEKATNLIVNNKYVFVVANNVNKVEIAKAIYQVYGVKAIKINVINTMGKTTKRGKIVGKRKDWKKAIVTLAAGETIKIYEGV
ncbi:50S ribosomal protein L23 [Patescibacteria group bacterium]|nr:50S ribosomal protein L23 [Patescibacteria group bacterium]MBU1871056.1 50S ribosomal protein L23 [Patescibacteria group bacterium]